MIKSREVGETDSSPDPGGYRRVGRLHQPKRRIRKLDSGKNGKKRTKNLLSEHLSNRARPKEMREITRRGNRRAPARGIREMKTSRRENDVVDNTPVDLLGRVIPAEAPESKKEGREGRERSS